jgi:hypothetical protein
VEVIVVDVKQCYRYLLVDCVQKGPVHPLLKLPPAKDPIDPVPIPLPGNMGLYSVWEVEVQVVDVQAPSVHSLQVSIYNTV